MDDQLRARTDAVGVIHLALFVFLAAQLFFVLRPLRDIFFVGDASLHSQREEAVRLFRDPFFFFGLAYELFMYGGLLGHGGEWVGPREPR